MYRYLHSANAPVDSLFVNIDLAVTVGGLVIAMLGLYWLSKGLFLFNAIRHKDTYFLKEYGSKKYPPFFFVVLGSAIIVSGLIVAFVPFSGSVSK